MKYFKYLEPDEFLQIEETHGVQIRTARLPAHRCTTTRGLVPLLAKTQRYRTRSLPAWLPNHSLLLMFGFCLALTVASGGSGGSDAVAVVRVIVVVELFLIKSMFQAQCFASWWSAWGGAWCHTPLIIYIIVPARLHRINNTTAFYHLFS